jgi:RNA polymerase sigma-70 factor (ECF subfamily)
MAARPLSHRETARCQSSFPPAGDTRSLDAFRAMYGAHAGPLLAYARRLTGDRSAAEDAVQETFLRAWRELPRVLRHVVIDTARTHRLRETPLIDETMLDEGSDRGYETLLDRELLVGALGSLSSLHREVLVEVYLRDRPPDRVAAGLGVPVGTVRSRLHYALIALRHHLSSATWAAECA